jgi:hypothetical protein
VCFIATRKSLDFIFVRSILVDETSEKRVNSTHKCPKPYSTQKCPNP